MWILRARARDDSGQASVELIALLPALGVAIALAWQALVAGETWWRASVAAREGARAGALGGDAAGERAARAAVGRRAVVSVADGTARVSVAVPSLAAGLRLGSVVARSHMEPQR